MKGLFLLIIVYCLLSTAANAQEKRSKWLLGAGITYCSYIHNPGLNLNITYRLAGNLHIGPDFSALLTRERKDNGVVVSRKELEYNFNATYLLAFSKKVELYPLAGINWSKVTNHPESQRAEINLVTALNLGGGVEFEVKQLRFFLESKWVSVLDKIDVTTGILLRI
jgi:hypothetical protein